MIKNYKFIQRIQTLPFIDAIYLFGSRTGELHRQFSDIDLAVVCPKADSIQWQQVLDIVEDADTLLKIDCVRYDALPNNSFKKEIDKTKKVIYDRTSAH